MVYFRLDERLAHGQVVTNWISFLNLTHIIIADEASAESEVQRNLLRMAVPQEVKLMVCGIEKSIKLLKDNRIVDKNVLVICGNPIDSWKIIESSDVIQEVNLANYGFILKSNLANARMITKYLSVNDDELNCIRKIIEKVKNTYCQPLSSQPKTEIIL